MSAFSVNPPYPVFSGTDGEPLENGYIWIGTANLDPQTNPINVFWDVNQTAPAAQPIRTLGGYPAYNGTPARLYVATDCSVKVLDKNGNVVYYSPSNNSIAGAFQFISYTVSEEVQVATAGQTVFNLTTMSYVPGTVSLSVYVDGVNQIVNDAYFETNATTVTFANGLHLGALVKFTTAAPVTGGAIDSCNVGYVYPAPAATSRVVCEKLNETVSVKDFGAVGDGVTDDTAAFVNAMAAIVASGNKNILQVPAGVYKFSSGISINTSYVGIQSDGATLDFSTVTSGAALTVFATVYPPYDDAVIKLSGFKLVGNSTNGSVKGILYTSASDVSHISVENVAISNFGIGESFEENSYLIHHFNVDIYQCAVGTQNLTGFTNNGENFSYTGGTIFNNGVNVILTNGGGSYNFVNTSFDYPTTAQFTLTSGQLNFTNCHIEGGAIPLFTSQAINSIASFTNCLLIQQTSTGSTPYIEFAGQLNFTGGRIIPNAGTSPAISALSSASLRVKSCSLQYTGAVNYLLDPACTYEIDNAYVTQIAGSGPFGIKFTNRPVVFNSIVNSTTGVFTGGNTTICIVLSTWYSLGVGTSSGLFVFRDDTSGGTAVFVADSSVGAASISNSIGGFEMRFDGVSGQMEIRVTSGAANRNIRWSLLKTSE
jgi:hypothetical protein